MGKFEISIDKAGEWRFVLKANNGKIVAVGEGYKKLPSVHKGIKCIKRIAKNAKIVYVD